MKNYIKPSANVIELAVKERLSIQDERTRRYRIPVGNHGYREENIFTNIYTALGISRVDYR